MRQYLDPETMITMIEATDDPFDLRSLSRRRWRCAHDIQRDRGVSRATAYRCIHDCWRTAAAFKYEPMRASVYFRRELPHPCTRRAYVDSLLIAQWFAHRRPVGNPNFTKK